MRRGLAFLALATVATECGGPPREDERPSAAGPGLAVSVPKAADAAFGAESLVHEGVVYRGRATVDTTERGPVLRLAVRLASARRDTVLVESERGNCNPPLYLRHAASGRRAAWSEVAWWVRTAPNPTGAGCAGTGLMTMLAPGGRSEFEAREHPVRAVLGDSLPRGRYEVAVGTVVRGTQPVRARQPVGQARVDTLSVPAGRVWLP